MNVNFTFSATEQGRSCVKLAPGKGIISSAHIKQVEVVWACIEKRRRIRRQESDGDGGAGKRRRGRPKWRWLDSIRNDLSGRELSGEEAQYRVQWWRLKHRPHIKVGKDAEEEEAHHFYKEFTDS